MINKLETININLAEMYVGNYTPLAFSLGLL